MNLRSVTELDPEGKRVVVRVDWNVTLGKALDVVDDTRIRRTEKTIGYLLEGGAKQVMLMTHLGKAEERRSIEPVVRYAEKILGREILLTKQLTNIPTNQLTNIPTNQLTNIPTNQLTNIPTNQLTNIPTNQLVMLENLRFWPGEKSNDPEFSGQLAGLGEVYVNEAFGESHREAASIVGVAELLPAYAGFNLIEEVSEIGQAMDEPKRPLVVVMGGAKVEDKIKLLEVMSQKADVLLLGGKLANEFLARGIQLDGSARVMVPVEGDNLLDIGEETRELFAKEIAAAKTVIWNGPMGKVEEAEYREGTHAVYEALVRNEPAQVIVGGGDTLASIRDEKHLERIDFVSTGGGAMLKLIEQGTLPGLEVLQS